MHCVCVSKLRQLRKITQPDKNITYQNKHNVANNLISSLTAALVTQCYNRPQRHCHLHYQHHHKSRKLWKSRQTHPSEMERNSYVGTENKHGEHNENNRREGVQWISPLSPSIGETPRGPLVLLDELRVHA